VITFTSSTASVAGRNLNAGIDNRGTIVAERNASTARTGETFTNAGTVQVAAGATYTVASDMTFANLAGGALTGIDEAAILEEIAEVHAELEPLIAASERLAEPMVAIYRRIIARCVVHPIAPDTYPAKLSGH